VPLTVGTAGHIDHGKTWLVRALTGKDTDRHAGEGARPQTHEHLAVLRLLGVERGVVAVTKADAVDDETLELALEEARELVPGAEAIPVSAKRGTGLDELRAALARVAVDTERGDAATRLYVDRAFTLRGIGTVATGTLWSGRVAAGDVLRAEPSGRDVRVRSVQVHDSEVDLAEPGQRVAVALPGVSRDQLRRGDVLVEPGAYPSSYRLDVELVELAPIPPRVIVHHGTSAVLARVVRVGNFAQLRLDSPVVAARGDRVVLRAGTTVGGGRVLDPAPPRHADRERFERTAQGEVLVHAPVRDDQGRWIYSDEWLEELRTELERELDAADPLDPGVPAPTAPWAAQVVPRLGLERRGSRLYRPGATGALGDREREAAELEAQLGLEPVKVGNAQLARFLEERGRLVRLGEGTAVSPDAYAHAREQLVAELESAKSITLARFRDLLGTSRRTSQLLLERFDADGLTRRIGDERILRRSAGRSAASD
jgi:selenocysteine-specific elongation factor